MQQGQVFINNGEHTGPQDLDGHVLAVMQPCKVHLSNGGARNRRLLKRFEELV